MSANVFDFLDYKEFIQATINSPENSRGYHGRLAKAAGMHSSFLSKVLKTHVHLTPDQAADMCVFWSLDGEETHHFLNLVNWARAASPALRSIVMAQIEKKRKQREKLSSRFSEAQPVESEQAGQYYSAWYLMCIHMILLIPNHNTVEHIAKRLALPPALIVQSLNFLKNMGLVEDVGDKWHCIKTDVHLSNESIWAKAHHINWLNKTSFYIQENRDYLVNFSSVIVTSKDTANQIKRLLFDELENLRKLVKDAPDEELYFLGINFFAV